MPDDDPYRWLEDVDGLAALAWARDRNAETFAELTTSAGFNALRAEIREVLDADDRIPYPRTRGEYLYNFWRDAAAPRGLWRRTSLASYRHADPDWDIVLDVDRLAESDGENWVWQGAQVLRPGYRRALVELSRGGADATVVREFDLVTKSFVDDGFFLPEAKSDVGWIDEDRIYVGTDFGAGSLTTSGYPRVVKEWRRGTPLEEAVTVFEGMPDDVAAGAYHDPTEGFARDFIYRSVDFYRTEKYLRTPAGPVRIEVPDDARTSIHREWLLITTRSEWAVGERVYPAGTLLAATFDAFLAGQRDLDVLFTPDEHASLTYHTWTRNHLIIAALEDVKRRFTVHTPGAAGWTATPLAGVPDTGSADICDTNPEVDDEYYLDASGYTQPSTLYRGYIGTEPEILKQAPITFSTDGLSVSQHFAVSADGTQVPYFVVGTGKLGPTLLYGYGGFQVSLAPAYSGSIGRAWLARGGTYVVANIRGGGEYGPEWHQSAMRENRPRGFEDFAAVARDLVGRGVTTPATLGIQGGSNGGLLMGVMLTRYPELFGAIVCSVPLLDMRRYHLLLAGASWMAEYGDPDDPADWAFIKEYSPYQNVRAGRPYPPTFITTSTRDDRVHPGHARKMAARLLELGYDVRYYENIEGGHGGAADNEQLAHKSALTYEFLWRTLSTDPDLPSTTAPPVHPI